MRTNLVQRRRGQSTTRSSLPKLMVCLWSSSTQTRLTTPMIAPNYPHSPHGLGRGIGHPNLPDLIRRYLLEKLYPNDDHDVAPTPTQLPHIDVSHVGHLKVFHSAHAIFCAPSNPSTTTGMYRETIRAMPSWNRGEIPGPRYDCVFVSNGSNSEQPVMSDLLVDRKSTRLNSSHRIASRMPSSA